MQLNEPTNKNKRKQKVAPSKTLNPWTSQRNADKISKIIKTMFDRFWHPIWVQNATPRRHQNDQTISTKKTQTVRETKTSTTEGEISRVSPPPPLIYRFARKVQLSAALHKLRAAFRHPAPPEGSEHVETDFQFFEFLNTRDPHTFRKVMWATTIWELNS